MGRQQLEAPETFNINLAYTHINYVHCAFIYQN